MCTPSYWQVIVVVNDCTPDTINSFPVFVRSTEHNDIVLQGMGIGDGEGGEDEDEDQEGQEGQGQDEEEDQDSESGWSESSEIGDGEGDEEEEGQGQDEEEDQDSESGWSESSEGDLDYDEPPLWVKRIKTRVNTRILFEDQSVYAQTILSVFGLKSFNPRKDEKLYGVLSPACTIKNSLYYITPPPLPMTVVDVRFLFLAC